MRLSEQLSRPRLDGLLSFAFGLGVARTVTVRLRPLIDLDEPNPPAVVGATADPTNATYALPTRVQFRAASLAARFPVAPVSP